MMVRALGMMRAAVRKRRVAASTPATPALRRHQNVGGSKRPESSPLGRTQGQAAAASPAVRDQHILHVEHASGQVSNRGGGGGTTPVARQGNKDSSPFPRAKRPVSASPSPVKKTASPRAIIAVHSLPVGKAASPLQCSSSPPKAAKGRKSEAGPCTCSRGIPGFFQQLVVLKERGMLGRDEGDAVRKLAIRSDHRVQAVYRHHKGRPLVGARASRCGVCEGAEGGEPAYELLAEELRAVLRAVPASGT